MNATATISRCRSTMYFLPTVSTSVLVALFQIALRSPLGLETAAARRQLSSNRCLASPSASSVEKNRTRLTHWPAAQIRRSQTFSGLLRLDWVSMCLLTQASLTHKRRVSGVQKNEHLLSGIQVFTLLRSVLIPPTKRCWECKEMNPSIAEYKFSCYFYYFDTMSQNNL